LSTNNSDCESLSIEINIKNNKNTIVTTSYRPPNSNFNSFHNLLQDHLRKVGNNNKHVYLTGDFNINLLEHASSNNVNIYLNTLLAHNFIPIINKPTRVNKHSATIIDHIITNNLKSKHIYTGIIKTDISDHFPIFLLTDIDTNFKNDKKEKIIKTRVYSEFNIQNFRKYLQEQNWELLTETNDVNSAYELFLKLFSKQYNKAFPQVEKIIKLKTALSPWMTTGLLKSSKKKQKLYEKFLKHKTYKNEVKYKNYKNKFEKIKKQSKKLYYSRLVQNADGDAKQTWKIMKEIIGKSKSSHIDSPKRLLLEDKTFINNAHEMANEFNTFFTSVGSNLASKIPTSTHPFETYLLSCQANFDHHDPYFIYLTCP